MLARVNRSYVPAYWDDFFNDSFFKNRHAVNCQPGSVRVNVDEDEHAYHIELAVPGLAREDIRIDLKEDVITISSERKEGAEEKNRKTLRREFGFQSFKRSFQLPESVDQENIKAQHEAGILRVELPKKEVEVENTTKQIQIN